MVTELDVAQITMFQQKIRKEERKKERKKKRVLKRQIETDRELSESLVKLDVGTPQAS